MVPAASYPVKNEGRLKQGKYYGPVWNQYFIKMLQQLKYQAALSLMF